MTLFFLSEFDHLLMLPWFYYSFRFLIPSLYPPYGGAHLSLSTFAVEWTIFKLFPDFHHPSTVLSLFMTFFPCPYFDRLLMSLWFYSLSLRFCFFFLFLSFVFLLFFVQFLHVRLTMFVVGVCWTYCPPALPMFIAYLFSIRFFHLPCLVSVPLSTVLELVEQSIRFRFQLAADALISTPESSCFLLHQIQCLFLFWKSWTRFQKRKRQFKALFSMRQKTRTFLSPLAGDSMQQPCTVKRTNKRILITQYVTASFHSNISNQINYFPVRLSCRQ